MLCGAPLSVAVHPCELSSAALLKSCTPEKGIGYPDAPADNVLESPKQICEGLAVAPVGATAGITLMTALRE